MKDLIDWVAYGVILLYFGCMATLGFISENGSIVVAVVSTFMFAIWLIGGVGMWKGKKKGGS